MLPSSVKKRSTLFQKGNQLFKNRKSSIKVSKTKNQKSTPLKERDHSVSSSFVVSKQLLNNLMLLEERATSMIKTIDALKLRKRRRTLKKKKKPTKSGGAQQPSTLNTSTTGGATLDSSSVALNDEQQAIQSKSIVNKSNSKTGKKSVHSLSGLKPASSKASADSIPVTSINARSIQSTNSIGKKNTSKSPGKKSVQSHRVLKSPTSKTSVDFSLDFDPSPKGDCSPRPVSGPRVLGAPLMPSSFSSKKIDKSLNTPAPSPSPPSQHDKSRSSLTPTDTLNTAFIEYNNYYDNY